MNTQLRRYFGFIAVATGFFMALLDSTIVTVSLPVITNHFSTNLQTISWVLNGYNLAFAVVLITASRLADQFGRKRVFLAGIIMFSITSYLCAVAPSVNWLIAFRVLQGLSAACVVPVSMPIILGLFPAEKSGALIGIWGAISAIAAASGPALGGIITEYFPWQWIFYINLPLGLFSIICTSMLIKESFDPTASRTIDWPGMSTLSIASFTLTLALIKANDWGWSSPRITGLFATAAVTTILFSIAERRVHEPMLPLRLLRSSSFSIATLTMLVMGFSLMCGVFFVSFFLTRVLDASQLCAGLIVTALPIAAMFFSIPSGALTHKIGSTAFSVFGNILMCIAVYLFSDMTYTSSYFDVIWRLVVAGAGLGLSLPAIVDVSVRAIPGDKIGIGSGVVNMARIMGMVLGVAVLVMFLTRFVNANMEDAKQDIHALITTNTAIKKEIKDEFLQQLTLVRFSQESHMPTRQEILSRVDVQERLALEQSTSSFGKSVIRTVFKRQKAEIDKLYPQVQEIIKGKLARAFQKTFRIASLLISISIVLSFFSENTFSRAALSGKKKKGHAHIGL